MRWYDPKISLFISKDPIRNPRNSAYCYVHQNPVNEIDIKGLESCRECLERIMEIMRRLMERRPGEFDGASDKGSFMRHCVASCMAGQQCGMACAELGGWWNEIRGSFDWEDVEANYAGLDCATSYSDCFSCCRNKVCNKYNGNNDGGEEPPAYEPY